MQIRRLFSLLFFFALTLAAFAQSASYFLNGLDVTTEAEASFSDGTTPLWLNANRYGLSTLNKQGGFFRASAIRPIEVDEDYNWRIGYGLDLAVAAGHEQTMVVQQAFAEAGYRQLSLSLGSKQYEPEFKPRELTSGSLVMGTNARPIPQLRLAFDWVDFPGTRGFWQWKGHGSFGMTTDGGWQKKVVDEDQRYTGNVLYHEKALAWKFGREESETFPLTYELSLKVATQFGGTTYNAVGRGIEGKADLKHPADFNAFLTALFVGGSDEIDGSSKNTAGNHIGSWNMRLKYHGWDWSVAARFERMFEDQSMMFIQYGIYDHLLGFDLELPENPILSAFTLEHLSTLDQSGAILHDAATNIPDKMNGRDNYYNHSLYSGYQHWGQTLGNPLITSPIYNTDGTLFFPNNRLQAWHLGAMGDPADWLHWRILASFTRNRGTYDSPLPEVTSQKYLLFETTIYPYSWKGWQLKLALGLDRGGITGNNTGGMVTISRTVTFSNE